MKKVMQRIWGGGSRAAAIACASWALIACGDPGTPGAGTEAASFEPGADEDVDPEELADFESKADGDPCKNHQGGTLEGENLLVFITHVNKDPEGKYQLSRDWEPDLDTIPEEMVWPELSEDRRTARKEAITAFQKLRAAAKKDTNLSLVVRSAYRSFEYQCTVYEYKVSQKCKKGTSRAECEKIVDVFSARPGRSEHQLGTSLDITSKRLGYAIEQWMEEKEEGRWLAEHAHEFGFVMSYQKGKESVTGYGYEPWHFRYVGLEDAKKIKEAGQTLAEYVQGS